MTRHKQSPIPKAPSILENFSRFLSRTKEQSIEPGVLRKVRLQVLTSLSAARFSSWHPGAAKILAAHRKEAAGTGRATVLATGESLPPEDAAAVNAAYAMSLDFDDYMLMGHTGYSAVLAPLAFLEASGQTVGQLLNTAALTNEVMGRLSLACFFGPLNGQMWSYIHNLGAAAALSRVWGLDEQATTNALALSLYQPNFCLVPGFWNDGAKLLTAATPLGAGIRAALYARQGLEGPANIVEGPLGFFHFFSFAPIPEFAGELGKTWLSHTLSYKRYPGTSYISAPVDAARQALAQLGLEKVDNPGQIKRVVIRTTFLSHGVEAISQNRPFSQLDPVVINFSVRYSVACALLWGDLQPEHFRPEFIKAYETDIQTLARKIQVEHDPAMSARTLSSFPQIPRIIFRMSTAQRKKIREHLANIHPSKTSPWKTLSSAASLLGHLGGPGFIPKAYFERHKPVRLSEVDMETFPMLQSARAVMELANSKKAQAFVPIPTGGAGTGLEAQTSVVFDRVEKAFGKNPKSLMKILENPDAPVSQLVEACLTS